MFEADRAGARADNARMLSHAELVDELRRLKAAGTASNAEIARVLNIPSSRVADIFATGRKPRKISVDEMKTLVEHYGLMAPEIIPDEVVDLFERMDDRERHTAVRILRSLAPDQAKSA